MRTSVDVRVHPVSFSPIVHIGPRLAKALPEQLSARRRQDIAAAAARAAVEHKSERLDVVVDLGKTYRNAGDAEAAVAVFRDHLADAPGKVDHMDVIRGYWYEWSVCEGERGGGREHALAWLRDAVRAAGHAQRDPFLEALTDPDAVSFELLDTKLKYC